MANVRAANSRGLVFTANAINLRYRILMGKSAANLTVRGKMASESLQFVVRSFQTRIQF
jgi:hypothetical protein